MVPDEFEASLFLYDFKEVNYFKIKTVTVYIFTVLFQAIWHALKSVIVQFLLAFGKAGASTGDTRLFILVNSDIFPLYV